jgi:hypothetical protein
MDPNDPDGSYDLCLSRPETVRSLCRVQIDPCEAAEPLIMDFVYAKLASMRVDSCTTEVKECLQAEDRCGSDYTQCIGLDTDTIIRMCPYDKLTGCQKVYSDASGKTSIRDNAVYDELSTMVQGIMLNIDNNFLTACQAAADEAMVKVCGGTEECNGLAVDEGIGSRSLQYKFCEYDMTGNVFGIDYNKCRTSLDQISDDELAGTLINAKTGQRGPSLAIASTITGVIYWDTLGGSDDELMNADEYIAKIEELTSQKFSDGEKNDIRQKVSTEVRSLQQSINNAIGAIEADPTVQYCMSGRQVQGMKDMPKIGRGGAENARFPELTKQMRQVIRIHAIKVAKQNYYAKYDELNKKMMEDYAKVGERLADIRKEDRLNIRREAARVACVNLAEASILAQSPNPPGNAFGKILKGMVIAGALVAMPLAGPALAAASGVGFSASALGISASAAAALTASAGMAVVGAAGVGLAASMSGGGGGNGAAGGFTKDQLMGSKQLNQWNFKQTITSTFNWETLECEKCTTSQNCANTKNPLFGKKYCKDWEDEKKDCKITNF